MLGRCGRGGARSLLGDTVASCFGPLLPHLRRSFTAAPPALQAWSWAARARARSITSRRTAMGRTESTWLRLWTQSRRWVTGADSRSSSLSPAVHPLVSVPSQPFFPFLIPPGRRGAGPLVIHCLSSVPDAAGWWWAACAARSALPPQGTIVAVHIHKGLPNENGPVALALCASAPPFTNMPVAVEKPGGGKFACVLLRRCIALYTPGRHSHLCRAPC